MVSKTARKISDCDILHQSKNLYMCKATVIYPLDCKLLSLNNLRKGGRGACPDVYIGAKFEGKLLHICFYGNFSMFLVTFSLFVTLLLVCAAFASGGVTIP